MLRGVGAAPVRPRSSRAPARPTESTKTITAVSPFRPAGVDARAQQPADRRRVRRRAGVLPDRRRSAGRLRSGVRRAAMAIVATPTVAPATGNGLVFVIETTACLKAEGRRLERVAGGAPRGNDAGLGWLVWRRRSAMLAFRADDVSRVHLAAAICARTASARRRRSRPIASTFRPTDSRVVALRRRDWRPGLGAAPRRLRRRGARASTIAFSSAPTDNFFYCLLAKNGGSTGDGAPAATSLALPIADERPRVFRRARQRAARHEPEKRRAAVDAAVAVAAGVGTDGGGLTVVVAGLSMSYADSP